MNNKYKYYDIPELDNLVKLIDYGRTKGQNRTIFYTNEDDSRPISFIEFSDMTKYLGTFLLSKGYRNSHIGILSENSFKWCLTYFGITNSSNVVVPLDRNENDIEIHKLIKLSDCEAVFYSSKCKKLIEGIKDIEFFELDKLDEYLDIGKKLIEEGNNEFENINIEKDDLAAIVFTSGTTGDKKGVMLSHNNLMSDAVYTCKNVYAQYTTFITTTSYIFLGIRIIGSLFILC